MYIITVTSAADSGEVSFRNALALAAQYTGSEGILIQFDEALAGSTIELETEITTSVSMSIQNLDENPVRISGNRLNVNANMD